ncbi:NmrA family NAD(P)-binding protein [Glycomyces xiaoerkulensis]|uniref:NmrA family NAD(P)-binding protein n=1 Tax=Glycomyces xiaoerkulensis TaxID=2038139 RepID=UPI000C25B2BF|nr:NAD(P)H-binding protein [Glycomyces xiaoerkulensis]
MSILVTGATGNVGRHLVRRLTEAGRPVRALTRNPRAARFGPGVEIVGGDLTDLASMEAAFEGATAVHLLDAQGPSYEPVPNAPELVELARKAGVRRATVVWNGYRGPVEEAVAASDLEGTLLEPGDFMSNTLEWAEEVRAEGVVREPFGDVPHHLVHEADIAAVAAAALTGEGHARRSYVLTGPEAVTPAEKVAILSRALGRELRFEELSESQARERMRAMGIEDETIDFVLQWGRDPSQDASLAAESADIRAITGRPARTFADWAAEHADDFR